MITADEHDDGMGYEIGHLNRLCGDVDAVALAYLLSEWPTVLLPVLVMNDPWDS